MKKCTKLCPFLFLLTVFLIGCVSEERDWKRACDTATIAAYEAFIEKYPDTVNALAAIDSIWKLTAGQNTFEAYEYFIRRYRESTYASDAISGIRTLMDSITPGTPICKIRSDLSVDIDWPEIPQAHSYVVYWSGSKDFIKKTGKTIKAAYSSLTHTPETWGGKALFPAFYRVSAVRDSLESPLSNVAEVKLLPHRGGKDCQICGKKSVGYCHLRYIYVCSSHNTFTDKKGIRWRCP